jgi:predicted SAM-dependent methyltransferase
MRRILHVGCGGDPLPPWLLPAEEIRLDIDDRHSPHIVASMLDMGDIGEFDVVYTSHTLEHVYPHEVQRALGEFRRVLRDGGTVLIMVPNLEDVRPTEDVVYVSAAGPVTGLDMIYGMRRLVAENPYMAHHTGFTPATLRGELEQAGFVNVVCNPVAGYNLFGGGRK